jgi:hypothetical protein
MNTRCEVFFAWAAIVVLTVLSASARAAPVPLVNAGFETDLAADPDGYNPDKTGWGLAFDGFGIRQSGSLDPGVGSGSVFDGENNYLQLQASGNGAGGALGGTSFVGGSQTASATIMPNTRYTLTLNVARQASVPFPAVIPTDDTYGPAFFNDGNPTMLVRLFRQSDGMGLGQTSDVTFNFSSPVPAEGTQEVWTRVYETGDNPGNLGDPLFIQLFLQTNEATGEQEALFDNISVDVTRIPEPGSLALLGLAAMVIAIPRPLRRATRTRLPAR